MWNRSVIWFFTFWACVPHQPRSSNITLTAPVINPSTYARRLLLNSLLLRKYSNLYLPFKYNKVYISTQEREEAEKRLQSRESRSVARFLSSRWIFVAVNFRRENWRVSTNWNARDLTSVPVRREILKWPARCWPGMYGNVTYHLCPLLSYMVTGGGLGRYMDCCVPVYLRGRPERVRVRPCKCEKIDERAYMCDAWHVLIVPVRSQPSPTRTRAGTHRVRISITPIRSIDP